MDGFNNSLYRLVSVGTIAENKNRSSAEVEVWLGEQTSFLTGELKADKTTVQFDGQDHTGKQYSGIVNMANTVVAIWRGTDGNRITPPDVRRGSRVNVYQYADVDKYYWELIETPDGNTRRLETVIHAWNASPNEEQGPNTEDTSYNAQVSTHDKHMTIRTSKVNGEPFAYVVQLNTKEGNVVVADDAGMFFQMNSKEKHAELDTGAGAKIDLLKADATITCSKFKVNAGESIDLNAPTVNTTADKINNKASMINNVADTFNVNNGVLTVTTSTALKGGISSTAGSATFTGSTAFTGGALTHQGKDVGSSHIHGGVQGGSSQTTPPV